jgi:hypothetical protein
MEHTFDFDPNEVMVGGCLLCQILIVMLYILLILLEFLIGCNLLLTLKSVGMVLRLLEAAML